MDRFVKKNFIFSQNLECHKPNFCKKKWKKLKKNVYNVVNDVFHVFNFCMVFIQCGGQKLKKRWFIKKLKEKKWWLFYKNWIYFLWIFRMSYNKFFLKKMKKIKKL